MRGDESVPTLQSVPFWMLTKNPIFKRYLRSRLRPKALIPWALLIGIASTFAFLSIWVSFTNRDHADMMLAGRIILIAMILIQGFLLMVLGTGSVASGMMLEGEDGGVEYQRLIPLSPLAKIIGYVFGLPVREYCLFLVTVPFTLLAIYIGRVPLEGVGSVYAAFFTGVVLYHLSGCVAGTVVNRRFAGRIAQMIVIVLYLVLPQLAKLGFEFFSYLTIIPVLKELISDLAVPYADDTFNLLFGSGSRTVSLYGLEVQALPFSLLMQGTLILTFVIVLYRKWRQPTHHMLGKNFAVCLCLWIHALLLGSTIPLIDNGEIFPQARNRTIRVAEELQQHAPPGTRVPRIHSRDRKNPKHAYWLAASYGVGSLVLSCGLVLIITPTRDEFTKGLRRGRKLGRRRVPLNADGASALWHVALIGLVGAGAFAIFSCEMFGSKWFTSRSMGARASQFSMVELRLVPFSQVLFVLAFWAVLEWGQRRALLLWALFVWVVPVLGALIFLLANDERFHEIAISLGSLSALPSPFYALSYPVDDPRPYMISISNAFVRTIAIYLIIVTYMIVRVKRRHREIVARVEAGDAPPPASREVVG
ncbi:MAG: hypothetical protein ACI8XO_004639 [Verrucomicrobiales bacterium]|jgi:hypothetical protein